MYLLQQVYNIITCWSRYEKKFLKINESYRLNQLFHGYANPRQKISSLVKKGSLIQLKRGLYIHPDLWAFIPFPPVGPVVVGPYSGACTPFHIRNIQKKRPTPAERPQAATPGARPGKSEEWDTHQGRVRGLLVYQLPDTAELLEKASAHLRRLKLLGLLW